MTGRWGPTEKLTDPVQPKLFGDVFVSSSTGSDSNAGTSPLAPWATLAKVQSFNIQPGARVFCKCGDTWAESFAPTGNGNYALSTWTSTFNSTLAANTATYQGGAVFSTYKSILLADGLSDSEATTDANDYCTRIAREDAIRAAHAAADSASTWIIMDSYGSGARPKIAPGGAAQYGINFPAAWTGGWKIRNIDIDACQVCGIHAEIVGVNPELRKAHGLWFENLKITNITGGSIDTTGTYPGNIAGYIGLMGEGICTTHINQIKVSNVECTNLDSPALFFGADGLWITGCNFHDSYVGGLFIQGLGNATPLITGVAYVTPCSNVLIESTTITNSGATTGYAKGVGGIVFSNTRDFSVYNTEIKTTQLNIADGVAIDFEGNNNPDINGETVPWTGMIRSCNFHDNKGAAFLNNSIVAHGSNPISRIFFHANHFTNNALSGSGVALPAIIGQRTGLSDNHYVFTSNDIGLAAATSKLFGGDSANAYSPMTDTPPAGFTYGPSNTKHFP